MGGGQDWRVKTACMNEECLGPNLFNCKTNDNCLMWIRAEIGRVPEIRYTNGSGVSLGRRRVSFRDPL